jgi:predicted GIY-YIG superfamily endonuclease
MPYKLLPGVNDLLTRYPLIALEAHGWDPSSISYGSNRKKIWLGGCGHTWLATVKNRTIRNSNCPYCLGTAVLSGFNDLATIAPEVAKYAYNWDPSTVTPHSGQQRQWICHCGYIWFTTPGSMMRSYSIGTNGCHACSRRNFCFSHKAYLYLMGRDGEQQIGITNNPANRLAIHAKKGWKLIDLIGPENANNIHERELNIKRWIRKNIGCVKGTRENWNACHLKVESIAELETLMALTGLRETATILKPLEGANITPQEQHRGKSPPYHRCY